MMGIEFKTLKKIEEEMDDLVEMAEKLVVETEIHKSGLEEHQLRTLENMANATPSVKVLKLFVRYQTGRHDEWKRTNFGKCVIEDFNKLGEKAEKITSEQTKDVHLYLIRLYLGFLTREFIAKTKGGI